MVKILHVTSMSVLLIPKVIAGELITYKILKCYLAIPKLFYVNII